MLLGIELKPLQEQTLLTTKPTLQSLFSPLLRVITVLLYVIRNCLSFQKSAGRVASVPVCHQDSFAAFSRASPCLHQDVCNGSKYPMQHPNSMFLLRVSLYYKKAFLPTLWCLTGWVWATVQENNCQGWLGLSPIIFLCQSVKGSNPKPTL